jgi:glyoxylase-like metal-dependent hydrolase (beta-lactamase superfamily II)
MKPWKIYILKYARRDARSSEMVLGDMAMQPFDMAYYMWAVTNGEQTVAVDMGFTEAVAQKRGRQWLSEPAALLESVGIDAKRIDHVIVTHLHWDHVGHYALFPKARFYVQEDEMAFWTGRHAQRKFINRSIEVADETAMVRLAYEGRMEFVQGSRKIVPGVSVHRVSGHTRGMQIVSVATGSGPTVIASDAAHTYRNIAENKPFPTLHDVPNFLDGFEQIRRLAKDDAHILPGHDGDVMRRHKKVSDLVAVLE